MDKKSVLSLKEEILNSIKKDQVERGISTEAHVLDPRPERRLAVGYSQLKKNNYLLELRVQKGGGYAHTQALEWKERAEEEANIEIIPQIEIPSSQTLRGVLSSKGLRTKVRPLHIGLSICHVDGGTGTIGAFIDTPNGEAVLSNSHVLSLMGAANPEDSPIYQPGRPDVKRLQSQNRIATKVRFIDVSRAENNEVDAAIAYLLDNIDNESNKIPAKLGCRKEGQIINQIMDDEQIKHNTEVSKIGRTTEYTRGKITAISLDSVTVNSSYKGSLLFDNVIEVESITNGKPFSLPGDSGSLVFTEKPLAALGLVFAGGYKVEGRRQIKKTYVCSIKETLEGLEATLLN